MATSAITETANELTMELDQQQGLGVVRLLRQTDAQMFAGWSGLVGLSDAETLQTIADIAAVASEINSKAEHSHVVLSGCGTSGRIAFLVARSINASRAEQGLSPICSYLCAGGDVALFTSQEAPEDNWRVGKEKLEELVGDHKRVLFIGVTCGFSAPYVASQLHYAMDHLDVVTPVLLGFNPIERARTVKIEGWDRTFKDVVDALLPAVEQGKAFILNPVVGPEPLTGSTRMKGGSATKILLELCLTQALTTTTPEKPTISALHSQLDGYRSAVSNVYKSAPELAKVVDTAGETLKAGGSIVYVGWDAYGIAGLVDASECPPTYNATFEDVRAFLHNGYTALANVDGSLEHLGANFKMDWNSLRNYIATSLSQRDLVIVLVGDGLPSDASDELKEICKSAQEKSKVARLTVSKAGGPAVISWDFPWVAHAEVLLEDNAGFPGFLKQAELAMKLLVNAVTTGGHVIKGKVVLNRMVDLQVSNNKLFYRSIGIVSLLSGATEEVATESLLRSIYNLDDATTLKDNDISEHVRTAVAAAAEGKRVVPTAIVLASQTSLQVVEAVKVLEANPVVRQAVASLAKK